MIYLKTDEEIELMRESNLGGYDFGRNGQVDRTGDYYAET